MRFALRWRSSCGPSNARATSWRLWPTRGSPYSAASTPCPRRASCRNTHHASLRRRSQGCSHCGTTTWPEKPSWAVSRLISISTPCRISASIPWWNPIIYQSVAGGSPAFLPFWPRMPRARSSAIRTPISARARRPRRSSASLNSGSASMAVCHLVFDSKLTTYDGLDRLDAAGITFITLRRRSPNLLTEIDLLPASAWRTVNLDISHRKHRTPRVYEQKARPHKRTFRQFFITDLGHDEPTILLTNDAKSTAKTIITRYAKRMLIENALSDAVRFFHIDALSSSVGFKVDFDMALL